MAGRPGLRRPLRPPPPALPPTRHCPPLAPLLPPAPRAPERPCSARAARAAGRRPWRHASRQVRTGEETKGDVKGRGYNSCSGGKAPLPPGQASAPGPWASKHLAGAHAAHVAQRGRQGVAPLRPHGTSVDAPRLQLVHPLVKRRQPCWKRRQRLRACMFWAGRRGTRPYCQPCAALRWSPSARRTGGRCIAGGGCGAGTRSLQCHAGGRTSRVRWMPASRASSALLAAATCACVCARAGYCVRTDLRGRGARSRCGELRAARAAARSPTWPHSPCRMPGSLSTVVSSPSSLSRMRSLWAWSSAWPGPWSSTAVLMHTAFGILLWRRLAVYLGCKSFVARDHNLNTSDRGSAFRSSFPPRYHEPQTCRRDQSIPSPVSLPHSACVAGCRRPRAPLARRRCCAPGRRRLRPSGRVEG